MKRYIAFLGIIILALTLVFLFTCTNSGDKNNSQGRLGADIDHSTDVPASATTSINKVNLDATSDGATITFQNIGATGWYPSRRDPAVGPCDAYSNGDCCQTKHYLTTDSLTPWNEDLIMTLRGPMIVMQIAAYQPAPADQTIWNLVSMWDNKSPATMTGIAFKGNNTETAGFAGIVGNTCLVDVSTNKVFKTGTGSIPYCPPTSDTKYYGWEGSKMIIVQAYMPHVSANVIDNAKNCGNDPTNGWYDAPWIGLSHGEMVRSGAFGSCHCYAKDPAQWWLADGCGQFNVFEVVNDNNSSQNFDVFSTNFFGYGGYVGEGPCGTNCTVTNLDSKVDLVNKSNSQEAATGAISTPQLAAHVAFRRPANGYRFFVMLLDVKTRTVQLALIHPSNVPSQISSLLPGLPQQVSRTTIDNLLLLRLPHPAAVSVER